MAKMSPPTPSQLSGLLPRGNALNLACCSRGTLSPWDAGVCSSCPDSLRLQARCQGGATVRYALRSRARHRAASCVVNG